MSSVKHFEFIFSDLSIKVSDLHRLLGYKEEDLPLELSRILHEILSEAEIYTEIKGAYVIKDILKFDAKSGMLKLEEAKLVPGKTICENIAGSEQLICYLCTAGKGFSERASAIMMSDPPKAYAIDMLGSLVVEYAAECFYSDFGEKIISQGMKLTNRYSPGHCGWELTEQKKLFSLFPENICGIKLNDSCLMTPVKSVSGIFGAGKTAEKRAYSCEICELPHCMYRELSR